MLRRVQYGVSRKLTKQILKNGRWLYRGVFRYSLLGLRVPGTGSEIGILNVNMSQELHYCIAGSRLTLHAEEPELVIRMLPGFQTFYIGPPGQGHGEAGACKADGAGDTGKPRGMNETALPFRLSESPEGVGGLFLPDCVPIHSFAIEGGLCRLNRSRGVYFFSIINSARALRLVMEMEPGEPDVTCRVVSLEGLEPGYLKFALWMAFSFKSLARQAVAVHSSVIVHEGRAILFLGESGTGKSTHTGLWLQHIAGSRLLNDDSPILCAGSDVPGGHLFVYGSPWSGKGRCYVNEGYPVAAVVRLAQHEENHITLLSAVQAFGALYPSFPPAFTRDPDLQESLLEIVSALIRRVPVFVLECRPDREAAELVKETIFSACVPAPS